MPHHLLSALLRLLLSALALGVGLTGPAPRAGDGRIAGGKFDILVYFTYPESNPVAWEPVFEEYSKLLLNATEGGLQLGTVEFTTCPSLADEADVWVLNDFSGARAHIGGLGRSGQHITISQTHRSVSGAALGQFGLAHETGHYVWALYDEYLGFVGGFPGVSSEHYCSSANGVAACLMDGGTTVFPNNQRTEFCTDVTSAYPASLHNDGTIDAQGMLVRTDQEYVYSTSCWRQIQRDGDAGLLHPSSEPVNVIPPHDPVRFVTDRLLGDLAMALLVDTSGSMSGDGRLEAAVLGSELALGMLRDGETQAVYSFDSRLSTVVAPQTVTAPRRDTAIARVGQLQAGGGTAAGEALLEVALEMGDVNGCRRFVVLLTDGVSADPDVNEEEIVLELQRNDILVYPVALGSFPDDVALIELAAVTGGQYFHAARPEDVPAIFAEIFTLAGGGTALGSVTGSVRGAGEITSLEVDLPADGDALVVALSAPAQSDPLLGLVGPGGVTLRSDQLPEGVELVRAGDVLLVRVPSPAAGRWELGYSTRRAFDGPVTLFAALESRLLSIGTSVDEQIVGETDSVRLETSVVNAVPVAGAFVEGTVLRPDGLRVPVRFRDDGHPASGDLTAGDGVYSALFSAFDGAGLYRFDVEVTNVNGVSASNRECGRYGTPGIESGSAPGREEGARRRFIAPFRAFSSRTVLVLDGAGGARVGGVELRPHGLGPDPSEGGSLAFALAVGPEESVLLERLEFQVGLGAAQLEGCELHLDSDLDGRIDRPRRPLALAQLEDGRLVFERPEGDLVQLPAAREVGLILLADSRSRSIDGTSLDGLPGGGTLSLHGSPGSAGAPRYGSWSAAMSAVLVGLLLGRGRVRRGRLALGTVIAALFLTPLAPGCSGGDALRSEEVLLDPVGMSLRGAVSQVELEASGEPLLLELPH